MGYFEFHRALKDFAGVCRAAGGELDDEKTVCLLDSRQVHIRANGNDAVLLTAMRSEGSINVSMDRLKDFDLKRLFEEAND
jgi:uncharacterized protein YabE (DUF348 family)